MSTTDLSGAIWRKSSRSAGQTECVEVADLHRGHRAVRDSKHPTGPAVIVTPAEWTAFTNGIRNGDFGCPSRLRSTRSAEIPRAVSLATRVAPRLARRGHPSERSSPFYRECR